MAQATTLTYSKFKVELGDGATPEVFDAPCGFLARALNESKNLSEVTIPDCDDEDAASWIGRDVLSMTWNVTGDGVLAEESIEAWEEFKASTVSRGVKVTLQFPTTVVTKTGKAHLATFTHTANKGERAQFTVDLQGDGALVTVITPVIAETVARLQQLDCDWADGHYTFRLPIKQLMELQEKCDAGPRWIRLCLENKAEKKIEFWRETIRLGLIGGGLDPIKAMKLVERYVDPYPAQSILLAQAILATWEIGVPDEALKKAEAEATDAPQTLRSNEEKSALEKSSDAAAPWVSMSVQ